MVALLVFIMATLEMVFGREKLFGRKRSILARGNVVKHPARHILAHVLYYV